MTPRIYITAHEDINGLKFYIVRRTCPEGAMRHDAQRNGEVRPYCVIELITDSHDEARRHAERRAFDTRRDLP